MTSYAQPEGVVASASAEQGAECCRLSEGPPSSTCRPPPPLPLPRLPLGVKPQFVGEWNSGDFRAHLRDFVWTALARVGILSSLIALVVVLLRPVPLDDPPKLDGDGLAGHQALAGLISMPSQYNRTSKWGSTKPLEPAPGEALHVAILVAHAEQEFPSLYLGHPAEPRLTEKGMLDAFRLGSTWRERFVSQGLLLKDPSANEATAQSIQDGRAIDTANALLLGLLPVHVKKLWQQHRDHVDCRCRAEPYEIPFTRERPKHGWNMDADLLGKHSATPVRCLVSCMGINVAVADDREVQPVNITVQDDPSKDVVLRQFQSCRRSLGGIKSSLSSAGWQDAEMHKFRDILDTVRQLKIPELCVIATGAQKCDTATLKDLPQLHEVMKAHAVQDNAWRKGGRGVNRQHFAYELFVATEWVLNHMFPESQGPQLGGILLGDVLLHWHSRLMSMDKRYVAYVVDQAAFAPQGREFERWNQLLLHQEYTSSEHLGSGRLNLYSGHRWQLMALLAALEAPPDLPIPEDLSHITMTLRSTQGNLKHIKAHGLQPDKLLVELSYCVDAEQCGRLSIPGCPEGTCSLDAFHERLVAGGRAHRNPNHSDDTGTWENIENTFQCNLWRPRAFKPQTPEPKKRG